MCFSGKKLVRILSISNNSSELALPSLSLQYCSTVYKIGSRNLWLPRYLCYPIYSYIMMKQKIHFITLLDFLNTLHACSYWLQGMAKWSIIIHMLQIVKGFTKSHKLHQDVTFLLRNFLLYIFFPHYLDNDEKQRSVWKKPTFQLLSNLEKLWIFHITQVHYRKDIMFLPSRDNV